MERTWLAYWLEEPAPNGWIEDALARVASHYRRTVDFEAVRQGIAGERAGLIVWSEERPVYRWPAWAQEDGLGVANAYLPVNPQRIVGSSAPKIAAIELARRLRDDPARIGELSQNSLAMGILDRHEQTLTILNDAIGMARLFGMSFPGGHVWSNQLGAGPIFAGIAPEADDEGWMTLASAGFFMGELTPLRGVHRVGAGSVITASFGDRGGITVRSNGALEPLVRSRLVKRRRAGLDATVAELTSSVAGIAELWEQPLLVDLSGGRDSRVVAAAAISSGADVVLRTSALRPGEGEIARRLVDLAPRAVEHRVATGSDAVRTGGVYERALAAHLASDGLRDPQTVNRPAMGPAAAPQQAHLMGAAGEIARDFFYKGKIYKAIRRRRLSPQTRLEQACRRQGGVGPEAHPVVAERVSRCLETARGYGLRGLRLLDYFFLVERLPRRADVNESIANFAILQSPAFIRLAFDISSRQHRGQWAHERLVERLIPEWKEVPYFGGTVAERSSITQPRIWETSDAAIVDEIIAGDGLWTNVFDADSVRQSWRQVREGAKVNPLPLERVFARVVWRAAYDEHLKVLAKAAA